MELKFVKISLLGKPLYSIKLTFAIAYLSGWVCLKVELYSDECVV